MPSKKVAFVTDAATNNQRLVRPPACRVAVSVGAVVTGLAIVLITHPYDSNCERTG